ncbi:Rab3 GTPase-activating protein catalytic subunit [Citrus sinensis]|uniref:Rab3 GTPase-activating protein catalytic subunit n=1 Tax=Citrus sinensis TaxID=2711 RepID=A0ACB8IXC3_CITSI|nr:Rab3 GTPase-activating protein catalytic subunit [Citrus sinensis]
MASTSKVDSSVDDEAEEEEFERFDDFTLASSWERFISEIEAICRQWLADGSKNLLEKGAIQLDSSKNLYKAKSELKYFMKSYCMEYYFEIKKSGEFTVWDCTLHDLQLCFGVKEFLVIAPQSASGVVLDAPEASKLLSAVAIALSNCSSLWPAFVPVHDPSRDAFIGIQNMGTIFTRRFEADRICSQVPVKLMHLEGLYELFVSKFAYSTLDFSMHVFKVRFTMKLTYKTLPYDDDDDTRGEDVENTEPTDFPGGESGNRTQWDDDCPWSEWYSAEDLVKGFGLVVIWSEKKVEGSFEMAEIENSSPHEAEKWILFPNMYDLSFTQLYISVVFVVESKKMPFQLFHDNYFFGSRSDSWKGNRIGFASQLLLLIDAFKMSFEAQFMEDFVSVENPGSDNLKSSMVIPSPTIIDRVLKDLFHEGVQLPDFAKGQHRSSRSIKGAPLESLFAQFCLHSLWFGNCNIRAFVWQGKIISFCCMIQLAICIEKMRELNEEFQDCIGSNDPSPADIKEDGQAVDGSNNLRIPDENFDRNCDSQLTADGLRESGNAVQRYTMKPQDVASVDKKPSDFVRRGSVGKVGSMMLLKSYQSMHAPFTQDAPLMTEDMHEERLHAVEAFGNSFLRWSFKGILSNSNGKFVTCLAVYDMSAFKAANPDAVFEDFIRWHSPGDWLNDDGKENGPSGIPAVEDLKENWPPRGRLSQRMSEHGNLWRKIWNEAPAVQASEQKPLLDPNREGEKILHYLETLRPNDLLEQMVCTAFRASADTLNQTNFGALKQMAMKMDQLYITMSSVLKPLQANNLSGDSETIEDLRRLCVVFEHVEKLLTVAASLHRKFLQAPRISEAIFSDFYDFYLPKMGRGSGQEDVQMEFDMKLQLRNHERQLVSNMFMPPTANQSWRKVLSMGNLLNGHEPILREIIFSSSDHVNGGHYAPSTPRAYQQEIETYRMYICGTSNDLRVALSVTSCD